MTPEQKPDYSAIKRKFILPNDDFYKTLDDKWPGKPTKYILTVSPEEVALIRSCVERCEKMDRDGLVAVPREPTSPMLQRGKWYAWGQDDKNADHCYKAMIEAATNGGTNE